MGELWTACDETLERMVAVKLIRSKLSGNESSRRRFRREARAAARLKSPHVVPVFDHGEDDGVAFIVMELLEGEDLDSRLDRMGRCPLDKAVWLAEQVSKGLTEAHDAGVIHRDLKPANLFLARTAGEEILKILDFGVARLAGFDGATTMTGELVGSPYYMSPEQALGTTELDHRSDLFALGTILFNALTDTRAFSGPSLALVLDRIRAVDIPPITEVAPELPAALDAFFAKAMARDRADRFESAKAMATAFGEACGVSAAPFEVDAPSSEADVVDANVGSGVDDSGAPVDFEASGGQSLDELDTVLPETALLHGTEVMAEPDVETSAAPTTDAARTHVGVVRSVDEPDEDDLLELAGARWWARPPARTQRRQVILTTIGATALAGSLLLVAVATLGEHDSAEPARAVQPPMPSAEPVQDHALASPPPQTESRSLPVVDRRAPAASAAPTSPPTSSVRPPAPVGIVAPVPPPPSPSVPVSSAPPPAPAPNPSAPKRLELGY